MTHLPSQLGHFYLPLRQALGVLLRSIIVEREPIYRQQECVGGFEAGLFGISAQQMEHLSDDRIGRALDRLFDADRSAMLTEIVVSVGKRFALGFERLHNDSTSISFCGQYRHANGRNLRERTAPAIVHGHSKDHRPDLKQLLFILTVTHEGVPAAFRCADGNTSDSVTHIQTWDTLRTVAGCSDFLYVADSKLCSYDNMRYIHDQGGRFVTVMPRSRQEDGQFRKWIQSNTPQWQTVWDRPNPRYGDGPRDRWCVFRPDVPSMEAWRITWVRSALLTLRHRAMRQAYAGIKPRMLRGAALSEALTLEITEPLFLGDPQVTDFIATGEASGTLPEMLLRHTAMETQRLNQFDQQVAQWLPRLVYTAVALWMAYGMLTGAGFGPSVPAEL